MTEDCGCTDDQPCRHHDHQPIGPFDSLAEASAYMKTLALSKHRGPVFVLLPDEEQEYDWIMSGKGEYDADDVLRWADKVGVLRAENEALRRFVKTVDSALQRYDFLDDFELAIKHARVDLRDA